MSVNMNRKVWPVFEHRYSDDGSIVDYPGAGFVTLETSHENGLYYALHISMGRRNLVTVTLHDSECDTGESVELLELFRDKITVIKDHVRESHLRLSDPEPLDIYHRVAKGESSSTAIVGIHRDSLGYITWYLTDCSRKTSWGTKNPYAMEEFLTRLDFILYRVLFNFDLFIDHIQSLETVS